MKLREALELIQKSTSALAVRGEENRQEQRRYQMACSSSPSHLQTFLQAFLIQRSPEADIAIDTLPYGDLLAGLEAVEPSGYTGIAAICEWYDLDPRLGFRRLGGWAPSLHEDIAATVQTGLARLRRSVERLSGAVPVALALPTLPMAPIEISAASQALHMETSLWAAVWNFAEWCASLRHIRLLSAAELDRQSPPSQRFDLRGEIGYGSPYALGHASAIADLLSRLLAPPAPLKGLITDLDGALWRGVLGEAGPSGVSFTLETGGQIHGLYQQLLQSLAERGVLLGVASKNDSALVQEALSRADLLVSGDCFFPVVANWGPKPESVRRILAAWNIAPESVVFIDDSPLEVAEVHSQFPQMRSLLFPDDPAKALDLFRDLRDWFGKPAILEEDRLRARSLQQSAAMVSAPVEPAGREAFLATLEARISFQLSRGVEDQRAFDLINKTNQFNLNGRRITEASWRGMLLNPDAFLLTASYEDKFGPLGKIAAALGEGRHRAAIISSWVMSCRAFSRHIEYATLSYLFETLNLDKVVFSLEKTGRNTPLLEFFASLDIPDSAPEISRSEFESRCPPLSHSLETNAAAGS
jgi:FkbH-like protein